MGDGAYFISVRQTDLAGNSDSYSSNLALTVDTTVATPTVNIFSDSADGSDRITNDATITVTGLEAGASWEYSINGGGSWSTGAGCGDH